ncbi:hypothetical protein O6H91_07G093300 [Diphasiastrum complanatum]|uniref:Uncharacterized protein n=2 Tax=Diphasiastrum complanatum TaxID=34168 RepID=A0ACC2D826_DIPCM|nr:hypothetical protein O6H91_07G082900 [Diphasiastrum complanatum]KAJ7550295.1 hypothetical protein O6H91_07G093300 [Diphasiastrum complanatum]
MDFRESESFVAAPGNVNLPERLLSACDLNAQLPTITELAEEALSSKKDVDQSIKKKNKNVIFSAESAQHSFSYCENAVQDLCSRGKSFRPRAFLSLFANFFNCWHQREPEERPLPNAKVAALLELSKRQQEQLADKQDTIDMLEWQLEQLQAIACKEHELQSKEEGGFLKADNPSSSPPHIKRSNEVSTTELLFEMAIIRATISIRCFCKVFMKQMEVSGYSVWRTLAEMDPRTTFLRKEHTAFALEARINKSLFQSFENDSFDESGLTKILDPINRCIVRLEEFKRMKLLDVGEAINPNHSAFEPDFFKFCESKTRELWALFPWNIVFNSSEERAVFTGSFLEAAKGVWLLHRLAFSMNPEAGIIRVGRRMDINPNYVEAVTVLPEYCRKCQSSTVEFMIMPGFRALKTIKCQVYPHVLCK